MLIGRCCGWLGGWSAALAGALVVMPAVLGTAACSLSVMAPQSSVGATAGGPIPIEADERIFGNPKAPVTLVTFIDLAHPASATMLEQIEGAQDKASDDLRFVLKFFPLCRYPSSQEAAVAAKAILELGGADVFWRFQKLVLEHQERLSAPVLRAAALEAGLPEEHLGMLADARFAKRVQRDQELGRALGVVDSPTSFMNGVRLNGMIAAHALSSTLEEELPKARALADQKHGPDEVYRLRTAENARPVTPETSPPRDAVQSIPVGSSPIAGANDAPITLVEFADFASGCSKAAQPQVDELRAKHGEKLRVVFKHLAVARNQETSPARRAANFAEFAREAGGDAKFFEAERLLWQSSPDFSLATLERLARQLGLDTAAALRAVETDRHAERIEADIALAETLGLRAPSYWQLEYREPSMFVNGHLVTELASELPRAWLEAPAPPVAPPSEVADVAVAPPTGGDEAPPSTAAPAAVTVPPDTTLPFRGARNAPVVVDMFANYISAGCEIPAALERLMLEHPASIKLVFRPVIWVTDKDFTDLRRRATEAALEAHAQRGNGGFWAMTKLLCRDPALSSFEEPKESGQRDLTDFAKGANIDVDRLRVALQDKRHRPRVEAATELATKLGVSTRHPTFFVNGQPLGAEGLPARIKRLIPEAEPPKPVDKPPGALPQRDGAISRGWSTERRRLVEGGR